MLNFIHDFYSQFSKLTLSLKYFIHEGTLMSPIRGSVSVAVAIYRVKDHNTSDATIQNVRRIHLAHLGKVPRIYSQGSDSDRKGLL